MASSSESDFTEFKLTPQSYVAFDGLSLKELIKQQLNTSGVFTDQNYEGSNISAITNIVAYSFHTLLFYLNQTANESMFSESQIYENMSRIVKSLDYKPLGYQTSILPFSCTAVSTLDVGNYTIPRYSYFRINNVLYSFNKDVSFGKKTSENEELTDFENSVVLYQGRFIEYPLYSASGFENETIIVNVDNIYIDHFNVDVYVKRNDSGVFEQWKRVDTLFLENGNSKSFEIRFNENKKYEIKFGNDVNGKMLKNGDIVAIYYLQSSGTDGEIGANELDGNYPVTYKSTQFETIKNDIYDITTNLTTDDELKKLTFTNSNVSSKFSSYESVDSMKLFAPSFFRSQYRLLTKTDFENYIKTNFSNILQDVKVLNNTDYLSTHVKYLYDIGLENPNKDERIGFNQINFSTSCNFNNAYVYVVPKIEGQTIYQNYLNIAQKNIILESIKDKSVMSAEVVFQDPVYMAVDIGFQDLTESLSTSIIDSSMLSILVQNSNKVLEQKIIESVYEVFQNYFLYSNMSLGQTIDLSSLMSQILNIEGISKIYTKKTSTGNLIEGLSLVVYNPIYPSLDIKTSVKNVSLFNFQIPYFNNLQGLKNKIEIISTVDRKSQILSS